MRQGHIPQLIPIHCKEITGLLGRRRNFSGRSQNLRGYRASDRGRYLYRRRGAGPDRKIHIYQAVHGDAWSSPTLKMCTAGSGPGMNCPRAAPARTIMTAEPKFVPEEAVAVTMEGGAAFQVRLIDCVGYMVEGAVGHLEGDDPADGDHPVVRSPRSPCRRRRRSAPGRSLRNIPPSASSSPRTGPSPRSPGRTIWRRRTGSSRN